MVSQLIDKRRLLTATIKNEPDFNGTELSALILVESTQATLNFIPFNFIFMQQIKLMC